MSDDRKNTVFGRRDRRFTIILADEKNVRHISLSPWMMTTALCATGILTIGYLTATSYLFMRDDIIGNRLAHQTHIEKVYEERIATLRTQIERVKSRQLVDRQMLETRMKRLLDQQATLSDRHVKLDALLEVTTLTTASLQPSYKSLPRTIPKPQTRPADGSEELHAPERISTSTLLAEAALRVGNQTIQTPHITLEEQFETREQVSDAPASALMAFVAPANALRLPPVWANKQAHEDDEKDTRRIVNQLALSLRTIEREQIDTLHTLAVSTSQASQAIEQILERSGLPAAKDDDDNGMGGPYLSYSHRDDEAGSKTRFDHVLSDFDFALNRLATLRAHARSLPVATPARGAGITSFFGRRKDPFLGHMALHAGIDFRTAIGTPIAATGDGTITRAGRFGSYGKMVEIDHGNGLTSRYAHLSRISVELGQKVTRGDMIGTSGNTGRSTGPHLHYEVRHNGRPVDPSGFLAAGRKLERYL